MSNFLSISEFNDSIKELKYERLGKFSALKANVERFFFKNPESKLLSEEDVEKVRKELTALEFINYTLDCKYHDISLFHFMNSPIVDLLTMREHKTIWQIKELSNTVDQMLEAATINALHDEDLDIIEGEPRDSEKSLRIQEIFLKLNKYTKSARMYLLSVPEDPVGTAIWARYIRQASIPAEITMDNIDHITKDIERRVEMFDVDSKRYAEYIEVLTAGDDED